MGKNILIMSLLLIGFLAFAGCTSKPTYSGEQNATVPAQAVAPSNNNVDSPNPVATVKEVATIDLFSAKIDNWDADPEGDGIEVTINPKDKNDKQVEVEGILDARIYKQKLNYSTYETEKTDLVKEWKNIPIGEEYGFLGSTVRFEFEDGFDYKKEAGLQGFYLEVDFIYNGKTYTAIKKSLIDFSSI